MTGKRITQLDAMPEPDGTELFVVSDDPSGTPVSKKVPADSLPVRAQIMFSVPGALSVGDDQAPWFICSVPSGMQLLLTDLAVKTAPTGASIIIDIMWSPDCGDSWLTIYSSKPSIADGDKCDDPGTLSIPYMEQGDILRLDIDQVGSGTAGADLTVSLHIRQGVGDVTGSTSSSTTSTTLLPMSWQSPVFAWFGAGCGEEVGHLATHFVDGALNTFWQHVDVDLHEIAVDLGESKYVVKIRLYVYPNIPDSQWNYFSAYMGDDAYGDMGAPVLPNGSFKKTTEFAGWVEQALTTPKTARFLKLKFINTDDDSNYVIGAEFEVYAS